jgi:predicted GIY-YIG superfamily endonuclease
MRTAVYRFFDADDRLLYVGITHDTRTRWAWHKGNAAWWASQRRVVVAWHDSRDDALAEEYRAIRAEAPIWNRSHTMAAGRAPYSPPDEQVAAEIAAAVKLYRRRHDIDAEYREAIARLADRESGRGVPIAHLAVELGIERKTVYRHLGRSMT